MHSNCGVGEDSWECKEIESVHPKGNLSWIFIGRTDAEAEAPVLWPLDMKNWLTGKYPDAGKDWRQEKGMTEDEMVGWHYQLNGLDFKQSLGVGDGQRSLVCCSPWGHKELDMTEWLNWSNFGAQAGIFLTVYFLCIFLLEFFSCKYQKSHYYLTLTWCLIFLPKEKQNRMRNEWNKAWFRAQIARRGASL